MALHSGRLRRLKSRRRRRRSAPETRRTSIHVNPLVLNRTMASLGRQFYKRHVRRSILLAGPRRRAPTSQTSRQLLSIAHKYHHILNSLSMVKPPEPSAFTRPPQPSSHQPVGPALVNLLDTSLTLPGTQTHSGLFMPYLPMCLPPLVPPAGAVPDLTPSSENRRDRLRLVLRAVRLDNQRYVMTLDTLRRRIRSVNDDVRHVKWLCVRSEQDVRNAQARMADLRQRYDELLQRLIARHAPGEEVNVAAEENPAPEQQQGRREDDIVDVEAPEPEGLLQRLMIDDNSRFGLI